MHFIRIDFNFPYKNVIHWCQSSKLWGLFSWKLSCSWFFFYLQMNTFCISWMERWVSLFQLLTKISKSTSVGTFQCLSERIAGEKRVWSVFRASLTLKMHIPQKFSKHRKNHVLYHSWIWLKKAEASNNTLRRLLDLNNKHKAKPGFPVERLRHSCLRSGDNNRQRQNLGRGKVLSGAF